MPLYRQLGINSAARRAQAAPRPTASSSLAVSPVDAATTAANRSTALQKWLATQTGNIDSAYSTDLGTIGQRANYVDPLGRGIMQGMTTLVGVINPIMGAVFGAGNALMDASRAATSSEDFNKNKAILDQRKDARVKALMDQYSAWRSKWGLDEPTATGTMGE